MKGWMYIMNIQSSNEDVGNAFKVVLERLQKFNLDEPCKEPKHICTNCKYRHMVKGYDQQWGYYPIIENWCDKDKNLMHTLYSRGNGKYFTEECDYFEYGKGVIEQI